MVMEFSDSVMDANEHEINHHWKQFSEVRNVHFIQSGLYLNVNGCKVFIF